MARRLADQTLLLLILPHKKRSASTAEIETLQCAKLHDGTNITREKAAQCPS
jgi:hypothetical protein